MKKNKTKDIHTYKRETQQQNKTKQKRARTDSSWFRPVRPYVSPRHVTSSGGCTVSPSLSGSSATHSSVAWSPGPGLRARCPPAAWSARISPRGRMVRGTPPGPDCTDTWCPIPRPSTCAPGAARSPAGCYPRGTSHSVPPQSPLGCPTTRPRTDRALPTKKKGGYGVIYDLRRDQGYTYLSI